MKLYTIQEREAFEKRITDAVADYIAHEDDYEGDVQLAVDPADFTLLTVEGDDLADEIDDNEADMPTLDYYPMMDFIKASTTHPGKWEPSDEAIVDLAESYMTVD